MTSVVYYLPNVQPNVSTTRYNHAVAIGTAATNAMLLTYPNRPPTPIADRYDRVEVLSSSRPVVRSYRATTLAEQFAARQRDSTVYVTTFQYAAALSGFYSSLPWVVDVYDDPYQYVYNRSERVYRLTTWLLTQVIRQADRGLYTVHPSTPHVFHDDPRFALNGAPVEALTPREDSGGPLTGVVAGTKANLELHLRALALVDGRVALDVFGEFPAENRDLAEHLDLGDQVTFHGRVEPSVVKEAVERSDVGFCLLPDRPDWRYAYPVRVGEYLAGGTIPVVTAQRGIRDLARDAGRYVDLTPESIAGALSPLVDSPDTRAQYRERARERATRIPWTDERRWFAEQALDVVRTGSY